jgi:hypothetical protein
MQVKLPPQHWMEFHFLALKPLKSEKHLNNIAALVPLLSNDSEIMKYTTARKQQ